MGVPAGVRPRPADALEGSRLCREESSSPAPESGEQWTPLGKVTLRPGGKRTQGARNPALRYRPAFACLCVWLPVFVVPALSLVLLLKSLKTSEVLCLYRRFSESAFLYSTECLMRTARIICVCFNSVLCCDL